MASLLHFENSIQTICQKKLHFCGFCPYSTNKTTNLKRHLALHTKELSYHCPECGRGFIQKIHLEKHYRTHTRKWLISVQAMEDDLHKMGDVNTSQHHFQCPNLQCSYSTNKTTNLKRHITIHMQERPYRCPDCGKGFTQMGHVKKHRLVHEKRTFTTINDLQKQQMAMKQCRFHCKVFNCSYSTDNAANLKRHGAKHSPDRPFGCSECGKRFKQKSHVEKHERVVHKSKQLIDPLDNKGMDCQKVLQCSNYCCSYTTNNSTNLKRHKATHTQERPFQCTICGKRFTQKCHLTKHQKIHERMFLNYQQARMDIEKLKSQMKEYPFHCPNERCSYSTDRTINLKRHIYTHTKERPFRCSDCEKDFTQKSHLIKHQRIHRNRIAINGQMEPICNLNESDVQKQALNIIEHSCQESDSERESKIILTLP